MRKYLTFLLFALPSLGFAPAPLPKPPPKQADLLAMQGEWVTTTRMKNGRPVFLWGGSFHAVIKGDYMIWRSGGIKGLIFDYRLTLLPTNRPKAVDMVWPGSPAVIFGVYELQGDTLLLGFDDARPDRPSALHSKDHYLWVFKRPKR